MGDGYFENRQSTFKTDDTSYGNSLYVMNESDVRRYFRSNSSRPAPVTILGFPPFCREWHGANRSMPLSYLFVLFPRA